MKGHIRERTPGHWAIVLDVRDSATGKRRRRWHSFAGNKRQAQTECARLIAELNGGTYLDPSKVTVAAFLEKWLDHMRPQVSPRTHERYAEIARKSLAPLLGSAILTKLQPMAISDAYVKALASGRRNGKGGLSPRTVLHMHRVLKQALGQAVRWQLLHRNPADAVDPPKVERRQLATYDMSQTADLLDAVKGSRMLVPVLLAVMCGLRRGEIAALKYRHVDLTSGQLSVLQSAEQTKAGIRYKPPKSGHGRTLAISAVVSAELRAHRARHAEELLKLGVRLSDDTFVCTREDGEPMRPHSIGQAWRRTIGRTNLPRARLHDLRHTHATAMLANGVNPKVASERLGHSKVGITLDLYSHVMPGMQEDAVARVDDALQAAIEKRAAKGQG